ncbi:MAG TPA: hypothetical protein PLP56_06330 [Candidatus Omnitrophota bacterium]|nr:hypothetical protein [Candidatus Omnitrophota bacterium]HQQ06577.1 hypothetical protein [Candidatus Omnitrophota bacterium]
MKKLIALFVVCLFTFVSGAGFAKDEIPKGKGKKEPIVSSSVKQVQGEVSNIGKRFISLVYDRNEEAGTESEMLFPIDAQHIKLEHKRSISEISQGDTVLIIYREEISDFGDRQDTRIIADVVRYLKPADAQSAYKPRAAVTEEAQDAEGLSLKGVK